MDKVEVSLEVSLGSCSDAFQDGQAADEVIFILEGLIRSIRCSGIKDGARSYVLHDRYGDRVGQAELHIDIDD